MCIQFVVLHFKYAHNSKERRILGSCSVPGYVQKTCNQPFCEVQMFTLLLLCGHELILLWKLIFLCPLSIYTIHQIRWGKNKEGFLRCLIKTPTAQMTTRNQANFLINFFTEVLLISANFHTKSPSKRESSQITK